MSTQPISRTLPQLIGELASLYGERDAIVDVHRRLTYRDLLELIDDCARGLMSIGVGRGDKVAILMGNRLEWIVSALAATHLGAVAVAVNTWWTSREIAYALSHAEARFIVCTPGYMKHDYVEMLNGLQSEGQLPSLQAIVGVGQLLPTSWYSWRELCALGRRYASDVIDVQSEPDDVAFILYTSGSTSHPKGVQLVHRGLIENVWNIGERQKITEHDRLWLAVSLFWGFGCSNAMMNLLTHGGCLVLQESFDAAEALKLIERQRCSVIYGTPNMIQALAEHPEREKHDLSTLRSGATLGTPEQVMRAVTLGASNICSIYGLTETYGNSHVTDANDPLELRLRSCGRPLPGVSQRIVDPETELEMSAGQVGEIRVKGYVTKGYFKDAAQTERAFDAHGYFRTGDLGCVDEDGNLFYRGRIKELVKTGGINVSPAEVEAVLMTHPDVAHAVVTGVPHPTRDEVLGALVVPRPNRSLTEDVLKAYCRTQLAAYKVPAHVVFCSEVDLPLTTTGKIQKSLIAATFFAQSGETTA
ncbi:AMP-binding protein [Caballeronia sp. S22]|uniref:AMP-binding protein n=1 Tax=Caballeronia sp. S22 TaxID=3137182 RepID=UPI003530B4EC